MERFQLVINEPYNIFDANGSSPTNIDILLNERIFPQFVSAKILADVLFPMALRLLIGLN